jgi:hypothetical protein
MEKQYITVFQFRQNGMHGALFYQFRQTLLDS